MHFILANQQKKSQSFRYCIKYKTLVRRTKKFLGSILFINISSPNSQINLNRFSGSPRTAKFCPDSISLRKNKFSSNSDKLLLPSSNERCPSGGIAQLSDQICIQDANVTCINYLARFRSKIFFSQNPVKLTLVIFIITLINQNI